MNKHLIMPYTKGTLIGFMGTGGVGKTTIMNTICDTYPDNFMRGPSVARSVFASHGIKSEDEVAQIPLMQMRQITYDMLRAKMKADQELHEQAYQENKIVICDRTIYDQIAYQLYYCGADITEARFRITMAECKGHISKYYCGLFAFPFMTFAEENKGDPQNAFRLSQNSWGYRVTIQAILEKLLYSENVEYNSIDKALGTDKSIRAEYVVDYCRHFGLISDR